MRHRSNPHAVGAPTGPPSGPPSGWSSRIDGTATVVTLRGHWSIAQLHTSVDAAGLVFDRTGMASLSFETAGLLAWDSSLLVFLADLRRRAHAHHLLFDETALPETAQRLLALLGTELSKPRVPPARTGLVVAVGRSVLRICAESLAVTALVGDTILRGGAALAGHARMRRADLLACMRDAGLGALPIVAIVNLLVGGILAFVGAVQLKRFGAVIYVANLVGIAVVREMAPLMTAIVMAGRTGGAYAAEIASMQGAEEIDALRAIGIPIQDYLILPRILALTAMMPLLYLYGSAIGMLGGLAVSVTMLQLTAASFITELLNGVSESQFVFGLVKSTCFGALVALAGCRIGLKAGRSAADVGAAATSAVVTGIVGIIALDAIFAVCANALNF